MFFFFFLGSRDIGGALGYLVSECFQHSISFLSCVLIVYNRAISLEGCCSRLDFSCPGLILLVQPRLWSPLLNHNFAPTDSAGSRLFLRLSLRIRVVTQSGLGSGLHHSHNHTRWAYNSVYHRCSCKLQLAHIFPCRRISPRA